MWGEPISRNRHSQALIGHYRQRVIRRRLRFAYVEEPPPNPIWGWVYRSRGQASKNNTVCSCGLCRATKYRDSLRHRHWLDEEGSADPLEVESP